jgi:hypothetical protein
MKKEGKGEKGKRKRTEKKGRERKRPRGEGKGLLCFLTVGRVITKHRFCKVVRQYVTGSSYLLASKKKEGKGEK